MLNLFKLKHFREFETMKPLCLPWAAPSLIYNDNNQDPPIAMFLVMSPFVINVPTRDLLVPYTKRSFQIMVGTLVLQLQC